VWWSGRTIEIDIKVRKHTVRERPHDAYFTALNSKSYLVIPFGSAGTELGLLYIRDIEKI
jgi:hypothetical protein